MLHDLMSEDLVAVLKVCGLDPMLTSQVVKALLLVLLSLCGVAWDSLLLIISLCLATGLWLLTSWSMGEVVSLWWRLGWSLILSGLLFLVALWSDVSVCGGDFGVG